MRKKGIAWTLIPNRITNDKLECFRQKILALSIYMGSFRVNLFPLPSRKEQKGGFDQNWKGTGGRGATQ
jgi:hypothetical protein